MPIKPIINACCMALLLVGSISLYGQSSLKIYKVKNLLQRLQASDTVFVINFWATWCKPCVEELPLFENLSTHNKKVKVVLVCLDFKEALPTKVIPFLKKGNYTVECVLLDEVNGQDFIDQIDKRWSGAIPMTLISKKKFTERKIYERQLKPGELETLAQ